MPRKAPTITVHAAEEMDLARKIWLAGVGAYGRVYAEAQGQIEKLSGNANEAFDTLVARGEQVEDDVRARLAGVATMAKSMKVTDMVGALTKQAQVYGETRKVQLEARLADARKAVEERLAPVAHFNPLTIVRTTDELVTRVAALEAEVAALKRATNAAAKPVAVKRAVAAAKKTAGRKPAAKAPARRGRAATR